MNVTGQECCIPLKPRAMESKPRKTSSVMGALEVSVHLVQGLRHRVRAWGNAPADLVCECMGLAPMGYLTKLRLALAHDALLASDAPLSRIARDVGYFSPFALSAAFRRVYSTRPVGAEIRCPWLTQTVGRAD
ncbi:helix-turn-helix domain-containing protein [Glutamicibacter sp.]|uniref:helix-turn-helix domain-containing protein n=1 Tax=Glutamicibacter sp. TaxID=1931995 RepID=UPI003D6C3FC0